MRNIIFINSHPIQYFAPLYVYLNKRDLVTSGWYCSDETLQGHHDREFGSSVKWDIPILEGYNYRFFKNRSLTPSLYNGFFGLFNPGMIIALFKEQKSVVVVHGWAYLTHLLIIVAARLAGHTVCLRGESPLNQELLKSKWSRVRKRLFFRCFIFPFVHRFLFIGSQNKAFYQHYGVKDNQLIFTPYAVDNARFQQAASQLIPHKKQVRVSLGLPENAHVILFTAKLIEKKRPQDLLMAYHQLELADKCLVLVGDGELRQSLEDTINAYHIPNVFITGFINQSEIVKYYAASDVFVLCSTSGETWGLSVNEALNFNLPVVVSDRCGCAVDLVKEGNNGFVFKTGDITELTYKMEQAIRINPTVETIIQTFSFENIAKSLERVDNE